MNVVAPSRNFFAGIDIGGTFTDVILAEQGSTRVVTAKTLTTPGNPSEGVIAALEDALGQAGIRAGALARLVHATTLATNLILEGKGARVGYVTTEGFGDLLQMGWGIRSGADRYDLMIDAASPPVERTLTIEASERLNWRGEVLRPLDEVQLAAEVRKLAQRGPGAYAVCLMHSYANAENERKVAEIIRREVPGAYIALSSEVWPQLREFERATTTVMSAAVGPLMSSYLGRLEAALGEMGVAAPLQIMQSNGGVMSASKVATRPIQSIESGPAAGVIGAARLGAHYGAEDIICFDMGGTTAKASLVHGGKPTIVHGFQVGGKASSAGKRRAGAGFPVAIPTIDLAEVGAGGGSIAWVDSGGMLQVGPRSAGATPGPACYGRGGTQPTVSDADLVLGYFDADYFLGGKMRVHPELAREAIERHVANPLGIGADAAAAGIYEIINANMAAAVRLVTVERGFDPSEFSVIAGGGAGPAHIVEVVEEFDVRAIIIPTTPGLQSAAGLLVTDMTIDHVRTQVMEPGALDADAANALFAEMEAEGLAGMRGEGLSADAIRVERHVDARFRGQGHELSVPVGSGQLTRDDLARAQDTFRELYAQVYGIRQEYPVQLVNFRSRIVGSVPKLELGRASAAQGGPDRAFKKSRPVYFRRVGGFIETPVYERGRLAVSDILVGPAIIEEPDSTTVVPPGHRACVGDYLQMIIEKLGLG
jgi:N-methylhydantoinase A